MAARRPAAAGTVFLQLQPGGRGRGAGGAGEGERPGCTASAAIIASHAAARATATDRHCGLDLTGGGPGGRWTEMKEELAS